MCSVGHTSSTGNETNINHVMQYLPHTKHYLVSCTDAFVSIRSVGHASSTVYETNIDHVMQCVTAITPHTHPFNVMSRLSTFNSFAAASNV